MTARLFLIFTLLFSVTTNSAEIPPDLNEWQDWVRYEQEYRNCPNLNGQSLEQKNHYLCAWPAKLQLNIQQQKMSFTQIWQVLEESKVPLPGDKNLWPQQVTINQKKSVVLEHNNHPYLLLTKGRYEIKGQIIWKKQPQSLPIPSQIALLDLTLKGKKQPFVERRAGRIWLGRAKVEQQTEKDYLKSWVNRLIKDAHPMTMTLAVELEVGGRGREQKLTQFDLTRYQLKSIKSGLNARIDSQGNLWVQLKPGSYRIQLEFKIHGFPEQLSFNELGEHWPKQEIWAYQNNERLRSTQIEQASPIDASQGFMDQWEHLPHYVLNQNESFNIKERHRGISHGSDSLSLDRQMWLSFDNSTYYFFDTIRGNKSKDWRINTLENYQLTQLSNHGKERLITYDAQQRTGAEIRTPRIEIKASGEVSSQNMQHASGWDIDFATTQIQLNIPPGRKLLSIAGADNSSGDWVSRWDLIDLFFVLITLALVFKSFGLVPGILALMTLILSYHEHNMPMFFWFNCIVALSLAVKITKPNLFKALNIYKWISVGLLLLTLLPFLAEQIRFTLYPQLELTKQLSSNGLSYGFSSIRKESESNFVVEEPVFSAQVADEAVMKVQSNRSSKQMVITGSRIKRSELDTSYDQGAVIQAGKGKPNWNWQYARYGWNGPVTGDEKVKLTLLSVGWVKVLRITLILFSVLWLLSMLNKNNGLGNKLQRLLQKKSNGAGAVSAALVLLLTTAPALLQPVNAAEIPSDKMLTELQKRLYPTPLCHPDCVAVANAKMTVNGDSLKLELVYQSGAKVASVLPGSSDWRIENIVINGKPLNHIWRNKAGSWISLKQGESLITINAKLKNKSDLTIRFPEKPKSFEHQLSGWEISGINSGRLVSDSIQLTRDVKTLVANRLNAQKSGTPVAQEQSIADLFFVTRHFTFANQWRLNTRVSRQAPLMGTLTTEIPLFSFEKPLDMSDKVTDGVMKVVLPRNTHDISWNSSLTGNSIFKLIAVDSPSITESWEILVYPNWNIEINGIPAISPIDGNNQIGGDDYWLYQYFPRAGEELTFTLSKPPAVQGASVAISNIEQNHTISKRKTTTQLSIEYRATRAETISIQIGEAELKSVTHDGTLTNLGKIEGVVSIGLKPGKHQLQLNIETPLDIGFKFDLKEISLNQPFTNLSTRVNLPSNRWLISANGPGYGPAIIYWGELIFFLLLAIGLSRLSFSPLNYWQWVILGLGMSTFSWPALSAVIVWLLASQWRRQNKNAIQDFSISISWITVISTVISVLVLVVAVPYGLLQTPDMGVIGNGSYDNSLLWFLDQGDKSLGQVTVYTLPLWAYKGLMLLWATWLSVSLIRWIGWIWNDLADAPFRKKKIITSDVKAKNHSD